MLADCDQHVLLPRIHIQPAATPLPPMLDYKRTLNPFSRFGFPASLNSIFEGRRHRGSEKRYCLKYIKVIQ